MEMDKVLEGIDLVDVELESLAARRAELERRAVSIAEAALEVRAQLTEVVEAHVNQLHTPSVRSQAEKLVEVMAAAGVSEAAIRAAIVAQFGRAKPAVAPKLTKPTTKVGEKKITFGLPTQEVQDQILERIRVAGAAGVRMEELHNQFATDDKTKLGVFATVKNACLDGKVTRDGVTRGMRYFWA